MRAGRITGSARRSGRAAVAIWLALAGTYMVFAGSVSLTEGVACALCAGLGTLWWRGAGRRGSAQLRVGPGSLRPLAPAMLGLPRQTLRVGIHLARTVVHGSEGGTVRERPATDMAWATPTGAAAPASRAVGVICASLSPDSYVLRLDRDRGTVTVHALDGAGP